MRPSCRAPPRTPRLRPAPLDLLARQLADGDCHQPRAEVGIVLQFVRPAGAPPPGCRCRRGWRSSWRRHRRRRRRRRAPSPHRRCPARSSCPASPTWRCPAPTRPRRPRSGHRWRRIEPRHDAELVALARCEVQRDIPAVVDVGAPDARPGEGGDDVVGDRPGDRRHGRDEEPVTHGKWQAGCDHARRDRHRLDRRQPGGLGKHRAAQLRQDRHQFGEHAAESAPRPAPALRCRQPARRRSRSPGRSARAGRCQRPSSICRRLAAGGGRRTRWVRRTSPAARD